MQKSRRRALLLDALVLVAAGAAAALSLVFVGGEHAKGRVAHTRNTVDTIRVPRSGDFEGRIDFELGGGSVADTLRVFFDRRTALDRLPQGALRAFDATISDANARRSRLLVRGFGHRIYAVPADDGSLCSIVVPTYGGECGAVVYHGGYPHLESALQAGRVLVYGLAANDVGHVDVRVGARWHRAHLGRNAYLFELPPGVVAPRTVIVRERAGATHTFTFVIRGAAAVPPLG